MLKTIHINLSILVLCLVVLSSCDYFSKDESQQKLSQDIAQAKQALKSGKYKASVVPENMTVEEKKTRFKALLVPPVLEVYGQLEERYRKVEKWLEKGSRKRTIAKLKEEYKAETDQQLLAALKPHPPSIVLAQAAMESAWGTSRFFVEANNIFGVWSFDKDEPRIAAGEERGDKTIWLKKYKSIEDAVRDNYRVLARGHAHQHFRDARLETDNPYVLVKKLDQYSELREQYTEELAAVISYNNFTEYDPVTYPKEGKRDASESTM